MVIRRTNGYPNVYPDVDVVEELKILGVTWNSSLTWNSHFSKVLRFSSQRLYVIRTLKPLMSKERLIMVYKSIVLSLILYAAPLFAWLPKRTEEKIEKFQRRVHRLICEKQCDCNHFRKVSSVRESKACSFLLKCECTQHHPLHALVPTRLPRSGQFNQPEARTSRRLRSFFPWTCYLLDTGSNG